jgi:hypothetical protein
MVANLKQKIKALLLRYREDFPQFAAKQLWIITKEGTLSRFILNRAQRRLWMMVKEKLDAGEPVRIYILKARQLGFSTLISAIIYWFVAMHRYKNALMISHDLQSAEQILNKLKMFWVKMTEQLRPDQKLSNRKELYLTNAKGTGNESRVLVQTADNVHLGASMTVHAAHLSEFARYEKIQKNVRVAWATLEQTIPYKPNTMVFLETTAWGFGFAKDFWEDDTNGFDKLFISWVAGPEYTDEVPLDEHELYNVPDSPFGDELEVREHVMKELRFWYPEEAGDEEWVHVESLRRLRWRRTKIASGFQGDIGLFQQEYPITATEAFLTTGSAVFDNLKLADMIEDAKSAESPTLYRWDNDRGTFTPSPKAGNLSVWQEPVQGRSYLIGVDVSEGLSDGDSSAVQVLETPSMSQVARWVGLISPDDLADLAAWLGHHYNTAAICCEINGPGYATNLRLGKQLYYPLLYRRERFDTQTRKWTKQLGWNTNKQSKQVLISTLRKAFKSDGIRLHDSETMKQMAYYILNDGKYEAASGYNDDLVLALALALQMGLQWEPSAPSLTPTKAPRYSLEWWGKVVDGKGEIDEFGRTRGFLA